MELLNLIIASVFIYAVIKIRMIIGKFGLSERVNYRMFVVNAFGMIMYVVSQAIWGSFFYYYATTYYGKDHTDEEKKNARAIATKAWLICNVIVFLSQLALISILCQLG